MKQLLIVSDSTIDHGLTAGTDANSGKNSAQDFHALYNGAISFFELGEAWTLSGKVASKNFGIALGRPNSQMPFIIPEVDVKSLSIVKSTPVAATTMQVVFTVPTPSTVAELIPTTSRVISPIQEYGVVFIKKGAVPHERNTWTVQVASQASAAADVATAIRDAINAKTSPLFPFTASVASAVVTVTCSNAGEDWEVKFIDCLEGLNNPAGKTVTTSGGFVTGYTSTDSVVVYTIGRKAIGDKKDIQDLASRCAAGKGFTDTYRNGDTIYPNYPEAVADTTYVVYTLRFRVGRDSAKTRDERVWQIVHIAVPSGNTSQIAALDAMLPVGKYADSMATAGANAAITKAISGSSTTAGIINAAIEDDDSDLYKAIDASFAEDQA